MNSCFASSEQQANPLLRGKPVAVAAYTTASGCILSPSIEAKALGIKVGMRVKEGRALCPRLIVLPTDPEKYRFLNHQLTKLLSYYTADFLIKSIDELVLDLSHSPYIYKGIVKLGQEIKMRIKKEVGDWIRVSVGISTNFYLAKVASGLHKPDGLDIIDKDNVVSVLEKLKLVELCGIKTRNAIRLNFAGIYTAKDFYQSDVQKLTSAFKSVNGYYWYLRLHGFEIDNIRSPQRTFGQSYALPRATDNVKELSRILCKLVVKMGTRLRDKNLSAQGVHLGCLYKDGSFWHHGEKLPEKIFSDFDFFQKIMGIFDASPKKEVTNISVSCFNLEENQNQQLSFSYDITKREFLTKAVDSVNQKWGDYTLVPALMMNMKDRIVDRISFGKVR